MKFVIKENAQETNKKDVVGNVEKSDRAVDISAWQFVILDRSVQPRSVK